MVAKVVRGIPGGSAVAEIVCRVQIIMYVGVMARQRSVLHGC